jgi:hypothetical protein
VVLDSAVIGVWGADGTYADTLEVLPGMEAIRRIFISAQAVDVTVRPSAFGSGNHFAAHPDGVWSGNSTRFELRLLDAESGRVLRILRAPGLQPTATEGVASEIRAAAVAEAATPEELGSAEEWFALSPRPTMLPAYDRLLVDGDARLWVRAWSGPGLPTSVRWWVFSRTGDLLGSVDAPERVELYAVGCAGAWGVLRDELDVSYVVMHEVRRMPGC